MQFYVGRIDDLFEAMQLQTLHKIKYYVDEYINGNPKRNKKCFQIWNILGENDNENSIPIDMLV